MMSESVKVPLAFFIRGDMKTLFFIAFFHCYFFHQDVANPSKDCLGDDQ